MRINNFITYAPSIVNSTSTIAMLNILYEWIPSPTFPNISLYLHNIVYIIVENILL